MTRWENNVVRYCKDKTIIPCPDCGSKDVQVMEHSNGKRRSITFECPKCGSWDHFDGFAE